MDYFCNRPSLFVVACQWSPAFVQGLSMFLKMDKFDFSIIAPKLLPKRLKYWFIFAFIKLGFHIQFVWIAVQFIVYIVLSFLESSGWGIAFKFIFIFCILMNELRVNPNEPSFETQIIYFFFLMSRPSNILTLCYFLVVKKV